MSTAFFTAAAAVAVAARLYLSSVPEPDTLKVLIAYLLANTALATYLVYSTISQLSILPLIAHVSSLNAILITSLVSLTIIRRLFVSPLAKVPGPKLAAITGLWNANEYRTGRGAKTYKKLHRLYQSDVIRVGPNEISINDVEAIPQVYGGKYPRGTFYEMGELNGEWNLNTTRDYRFHTPWRRIWYF